MFGIKIKASTLVTLLGILCVGGASDVPTTCQHIPGMTNVNAILLAGRWYEEVRTPAKNVSCVQIDVDVINNDTQLSIKTMYSASQKDLLMDQISYATVNMGDINGNDEFNVTYSTGSYKTYKILITDYDSNAVLCGYTNRSDTSTSFGAILSRHRVVNSTWLMEVKGNASQILASFNDSTTANITQSKSCYASSAATTVPLLTTTLFAALYAIRKFTF